MSHFCGFHIYLAEPLRRLISNLVDTFIMVFSKPLVILCSISAILWSLIGWTVPVHLQIKCLTQYGPNPPSLTFSHGSMHPNADLTFDDALFHGWPSTQPNWIAHILAAHRWASHNPAARCAGLVVCITCSDYLMDALSQCKTTLQCNVVSHWRGASTERSLTCMGNPFHNLTSQTAM